MTIGDVAIFDLEDAVAPDNKANARQALLSAHRNRQIDWSRAVVRINPPGSADHDADVRLVEDLGVPRIMVAKAEEARGLASLDTEVIALIETARGVMHVDEIASARNVIGLMWGADDLVASLGGFTSRTDSGRYHDVVRFARANVLVAAKAHLKWALDAVYMDIRDHDGLRRECLEAVSVGFDAKVAIHPDQVATIRAQFRPTPEMVSWARRLSEARSGGDGVMTFEGKMVDGPVYRQAESILRRAHSKQEDR
jgi:citrate lyase subunit beta/citryl-CoA lyase